MFNPSYCTSFAIDLNLPSLLFQESKKSNRSFVHLDGDQLLFTDFRHPLMSKMWEPIDDHSFRRG
jgi:hypothetical protein